LVIDSIYKTNRYGMPLVNIVGITPLNRSFYAASVFMASETENDFIFMFEALKRMYDEKSLPYPKSFVSDGDPAQIKAMQ
jgi:MULE transposase domain